MLTPKSDAALRRIAAVITREMRSLARYRTPFVLRTVYGALIVALVGLFGIGLGRDASWSGAELALFGYRVFAMIVWVQSFLTVALGVLIGVVSIATERRERTLGLVTLSQLRPADVVLGKLTALFALLSMVLLAGLPVYALVGWAGGVDYVWIARLALLTAVQAVLAIAIGLAAGLAATSGFAAVLYASAFVTLPPFLGLLWYQAAGKHEDAVVRILASGLQAVVSVASQEDESGWFVIDVLLLAALALAAILYAIRILPRAAAEREGPGLRGVFEKLDRLYERINLGGIRLGRDRRELSGHPVSWLTRTTSGTALPRYGFRLIATIVVVSMLSTPFLFLGGLLGTLTLFVFGSGLVVAMVAFGANGIGEEKARRSLSVLLATPLTSSQILRGKMLATLPVMLVLSVPAGFFLAWTWLADPRAFPDAAIGIALLLAEGLFGYFLALQLSLFVATPLRAGIAAVVVQLASHVVFAWAINLSDGSVWFLAACTLAAIAAAVWRGRLRHEIRFAGVLATVVLGGGLLWIGADRLGLMDSEVTVYPFLLSLLATLSFLTWLHASRTFDRILGRTP